MWQAGLEEKYAKCHFFAHTLLTTMCSLFNQTTVMSKRMKSMCIDEFRMLSVLSDRIRPVSGDNSFLNINPRNRDKNVSAILHLITILFRSLIIMVSFIVFSDKLVYHEKGFQ